MVYFLETARSGNHCLRFLHSRNSNLSIAVAGSFIVTSPRIPAPTGRCNSLHDAVGYEERYKFLIHDRDSIFASHLDDSIRALGVKVLKSAPHAPKMNAICERVIGTVRRECLDWLVPLSESHLRRTLKSWIVHYNCASYYPTSLCAWKIELVLIRIARAGANSVALDTSNEFGGSRLCSAIIGVAPPLLCNNVHL